MRVGTLRRRILIQIRQVTQDTYGQQVTNWIDLLTSVPADIQALSGRELIAAQAVNSEVTHQIVIRYHPLMADPIKVAAMRAIYVNEGVTRYFNLQSSMNVDERNREIDLMAVEGLNKG